MRTQIVLRWIAITGQLCAILVAQFLYGLQIQLGLAYLVIGLSAIANLVASFVFPENKRMSERENLSMIIVDVVQLSCLLYLTGGLHNPFSMMLIGPIIVAASVTNRESTILAGALTILSTSFLAAYHIPLSTRDLTPVQIPSIFVFGNWLAILITVVFLGFYSRRLNEEIRGMSDALAATQMALAREQKLTDLGGVVAAAAHELGTPLATIKLASSDLVEELADQPDLCEDAQLISEQTDRCRDILRDMGRVGKDDSHVKNVPLITLVREAAEPHHDRGINIEYSLEPLSQSSPQQPTVQKKPEIVHGLRNLIQNAVDFSKTAVFVEVRWSEDIVRVRIIDDGPGYPSNTIGRLGDPLLKLRRDSVTTTERPGYEGMGLGLFIAKTLLERSGAETTFANGNNLEKGPNGQKLGAIAMVTWPRSAIEQDSNRAISSQNVQFGI